VKRVVLASKSGISPFHEPWWLAAATGGEYREATVNSGAQIIGRMPYLVGRKKGFTISEMPPFTHLLGPVVELGEGKPQTLLLRRLSIIREMLDQLPRFAWFRQTIGVSLVDGLAFQDRGFRVSPQYTFQIDCHQNLEDIWAGMHFKTRQHIRRAREKFSVATLDDPQPFVDFYLDNLRRAGQRSYIDFATFPALFDAARERQSAEILSASWSGGQPAAMVVLVWGHGQMYYLLSTRARDEGDNGSINLLVWEAITRAHTRRLLFDLDGVTTSGTARFLSGYGGRFAMRLIVQRTSELYGTLRSVKRCLLGQGNAESTFW
jgi:hypothetical protein